MDPQVLVGPASSVGAPAPYWLLVTLKVFGFTLHMGAMHLWFAGILFALIMRVQQSERSRKLGERLLQQMPVIIAAGVNLGIVPLLFLQVSYYRVFYPATILMAWPWLSIILMLMVAYYGVYVHVVGLRSGHLTSIHRWAGWIAAVLFICIGFIYSSGLSLMARPDQWVPAWSQTGVAGAPLGLAMFAGPEVWARWLMMFGLAVTTLAAYVVIDTALFAGKESDNYRRWAGGLGIPLYLAGMLWYAVAGLWYVLGTWPAPLQQQLLTPPTIALVLLTAAGPGLPFLILIVQRGRIVASLALLLGAAQLAMLGLQAVSRQLKQNLQLAQYFDPAAERLNVQWDVLVLFLVLFVGGIALIVWMVGRAAQAHGREVRAGGSLD